MSKSEDESGGKDPGAPADPPAGKARPAGDEREARLAAALRANLRRRKAATRPPESGR